MDLELRGKRAIVTGGSRGIGKAIALQLAREGVDVVIAARNKDALTATANELASATRQRIIPLVADTSDETSVNALVDNAIAELGGVDILVNNAALPGGISTATQVGEVIDAHVLEDINVKVVGY
ncbi:MAG TPA: SDR family NAD(P)-dependent oxidoreductase, partial [Polyangiales bacterium]